jgi:hypothetical protein
MKRHAAPEGEVCGKRRGASRCLCVPGPLGSVNHLLDTSHTTAGTYQHWP